MGVSRIFYKEKFLGFLSFSSRVATACLLLPNLRQTPMGEGVGGEICV